MLAAAITAQGYATLLGHESFSYNPGPLQGQNGGSGWTNAWTSNVSTAAGEKTHVAALPPMPASPAGHLVNNTVSDISTRNFNTAIANQISAPGGLWLSFVVDRTAMINGFDSSTVFLQFGPNALTDRVQIGVRQAFIDARIGGTFASTFVPTNRHTIVANISGTGPSYNLTIMAPNVPGDMFAWVSPSGNMTFDGTNLFTVTKQNATTNPVTIDEIRFGMSYADVAVPEPGTLAALGLGAIALLRKKRK